MKFRKLVTVLMSAALLAGTLTACGGDKAANQTSGAASGDTATAAESAEPQKVVMGFLAATVPTADEEAAVEEAINAITRDSIGVEVDLLILDGMSYAQQATLMLSGNEQLDIFTCLVLGFPSMVNYGYALNLSENGLIDEYGQGALKEMADLIDGCRYNGDIYGIPQNYEYGSKKTGIIITQDALDAIGYSYSKDEVNVTTFEEIDNIFAQLHEAFPDKNVFLPQNQVLVPANITCDAVGGDYYGVLMQADENLEISNLFTTPEYMDAVRRMHDWYQKGYYSPDVLTSGQTVAQAVASGTALAYYNNIQPSVITQVSEQLGMDVAAFQIGGSSLIGSSDPSGKCWCINSNTKNPAAAMKLLNAFYTDPALADLLAYGIKDVDYVVTEDGHYAYPEGSDGQVGYHPNIAWLMPNEFITGVWAGTDLDIWEKTRAFNSEAAVSKALGFMFDNSEFMTEYTALSNIYQEYRDQIEFGMLDPDVAVPEMLEKMKKAGLEEYMNEKQRQLDAWAAQQ